MTTNTATVTTIYQSIAAGQTPAAADLVTYVALMSSGSWTADQVATGIESSSFVQNVVDPIIRLYQTAFGHVPDQASLNAWAAAIAPNGASGALNTTALANLGAAVAGTGEFQSLYGAQYTPSTVVTSANGAALVAALYHVALGTVPIPERLNFWVTAGLTVGQLLQAMAASSEFVSGEAPGITAFQTSEAAGTPLTGSLNSLTGTPQPISATGNYVVASILTVAATTAPFYMLAATTPDSNFTDLGSIQFSSSLRGLSLIALDVAYGGLFTNSLIKIGQNASFTVSDTGVGATAYGVYSFGNSPVVENDGTFRVSAIQAATGVTLGTISSSRSTPSFINTGAYQVSAATAVGVWGYHGGILQNSSAITVTGGASATGFYVENFTGGSVTNSGTLTATAPGGAAYGIRASGAWGTAAQITNSGTITAQHAISIFNSGNTTAQSPLVQITNTGTINGDIDLGLGHTGAVTSAGTGSTIHNTGAINGPIHLSTVSNDVYDGRGGTLTGAITLGGGYDTVYLGNDGGTVIGGSGVAAVTGGSGADTIGSGSGSDTLDGGGGVNTVSYASATAGVTVSLTLQGAAQNTVGAGSDTLSHFQNLTGSAFNDTISGDDNNNVLNGGGGLDTVSYAGARAGVTVSLALQGTAQNTVGAGTDTLSNFRNLTGSGLDDTLRGDANNNILDGGGGANIAVFQGSADQYTVSTGANGVRTVTDSVAGRDGTDTLINIQQIRFATAPAGSAAGAPATTVVYDLHSTQDTLVYQLYQAAYGRTPDNGGFRYWAGVADANHTSAVDLADSFLGAPEFTQLYGASPNSTTYVTGLYTHVLGRAPDAGGLAYWVGLADGGLPSDQLLVSFATSAENVQLIGPHTSNGFWTTS